MNVLTRSAAALALWILALGLVPAAASAQHQLNFRNADMQAFIDDVSIVTGYTFIVDPEVRGQVTITSQTSLSEREVFEIFLATLRTHGYAAVRLTPGVYQIIPEAEGARAGPDMLGGQAGSSFVTAVVRLESISARDAIRAVGPMVSASGAVNAIDQGNLAVIVDYASNASAITDVLRAMDRDNSVTEMVPLQNISAEEMERVIQQMRNSTASGEDDQRYQVTTASVPASNSIILRGDRQAVEEMMALIARVDSVSRSSQTFRVIYLNHADGAALLPILEQFAGAITEEGSGPASADGTAIAYHQANNALIVNGNPEILRKIEQVVRQLDVRRPQVVIEAIIVEISDTAARDLGVQYLIAGDGDNAVPFSYSRFEGAQPDLLALTGALTGGGGEDSLSLRQAAISSILGSAGGVLGIGGQSDDGTLFGLILNALESDSGSNVLSKPSVMVLDNEEASLLVGQEIPVTTGEALGTNNSNPFRTIEREDVGVQLDVVPQINEGDTIRLRILQEVSSLAGPVGSNFSELITNERRIGTTVLADDGEIIVLGGLIESDQQLRADRVPGLGNIPVLGRLFTNESRSEARTNLMVFIRPVIVRSREDMRKVTERNYRYIEGEQRRATRGGGSSLEEVVEMMMEGRDPFPAPGDGSGMEER